jgi:hypothetical protein
VAVAREQPEQPADQQGAGDREGRDLQIDACRPDRAREDVAAELIGAERVRPGRRRQQRFVVERQRIVRRDPAGDRGADDHQGEDRAARQQCAHR